MSHVHACAKCNQPMTMGQPHDCSKVQGPVFAATLTLCICGHSQGAHQHQRAIVDTNNPTAPMHHLACSACECNGFRAKTVGSHDGVQEEREQLAAGLKTALSPKEKTYREALEHLKREIRYHERGYMERIIDVALAD